MTSTTPRDRRKKKSKHKKSKDEHNLSILWDKMDFPEEMKQKLFDGFKIKKSEYMKYKLIDKFPKDRKRYEKKMAKKGIKAK